MTAAVNGRQTYATIFVHNDALAGARAVAARLAAAGTITESERRALADVLDPLPEVDRFGYLPNVRRSHLLPKVAAK